MGWLEKEMDPFSNINQLWEEAIGWGEDTAKANERYEQLNPKQ